MPRPNLLVSLLRWRSSGPPRGGGGTDVSESRVRLEHLLSLHNKISVSLSLSPCLPVYPSVCLSVCLSISPSLYFSKYLSLSLSLCCPVVQAEVAEDGNSEEGSEHPVT